MEIVMNVELEWDFADPDMRRYVDGFQITPFLDRVSGNRDVNMIHIKQRTGADVFVEMQAWQGRPIDYRLFVILRHQDVEAILEAEMLVFALMEKIKMDLEEYLQTVRRTGDIRLVYSNHRITCGVCHVSRQSSLKDFKLHVRSHIGDTTYYPPVQYKPPVARRPEPLATQAKRPSRPSAPNPSPSRYDYESLISHASSDYRGESKRRKPSLDYNQLLRDYREPSWSSGGMGGARGRFDDDDDDDQWGGGDSRGRASERSFGRSRSPQRRRSYRRRSRSRSSSDEDHYTYRKKRQRSRSGSYDSTERKRIREALYMGRSGSRARSRSPEWSTSGSRKRPASPFQSRYEKEMKKKSVYRPYEAQAALIDEMIENARKASSESPRKKMQQEPQMPLTKKQRKMQARKAQKEENWMGQGSSWMQDVSGMSEKRGGKKGMGDSSNVPSVMNLNLGEEHMSMADAAAWYAKQRMMGMQQQQQQQQMGQFGGMGQFGPGGGPGFVGGPGPGGQSLYPSLMGMIRGPGPSFHGGGGAMGMGMGGMGMGKGMGHNFPMGGGGNFVGGPGNYGSGPMQGKRQQVQKPSKTPKAPETPIKLELRPGFVTDIMLSEPRESSPTGESEAGAPKITVDKTVDPLKDEDPIGARYWKGMPPKPATAKSKAGKTDDGDTVLPELQEEKKDAHPIPSTFDYKLRYKDLKTSAEVLLKKIPTMTADALKTALGNIGTDVEPEIMKEVREKHKEAIEKLKEDKYWLYTAQYEDVLNRTRQLGKLFCEHVISDKYPVPESKPSDGMDILELIMGKSDILSEEAKVEKMEQFFTALLKQKETSEMPDEFWDERLKLLKEACGFNDTAHRNYIMKRINQLQESVVKRTSEIPVTKEAHSMELNVIYAMVNERLRQESTIETIDSRLDMRSNVRKHRKSEKLKTLQDDAKLKAEMWTLERQAEDGIEEEEDDEEEEEQKEETPKKAKKDDAQKEEIKENGKDEEEGDKEEAEKKDSEAKENGKDDEEKEKDETEEKEKEGEEDAEKKEKKSEKKEKVVEKIHPVIDEHPVAISKESRRLWKLLPKIPADGELNLDESKELLEFLYENSPEDLYLREILSNFSWKKQVAAIEAIHDVPGMRYVCKDCGSGWFVFENCLTHSLVCNRELALVCPMCPEPHIIGAKNIWRYIQHVKNHQENLEKFVEKVEKAEAEEKARIKAEEEAKAKAEEEAKAKAKAEEEAKAKAEEEAKINTEKGDAEEEMETKTEESKDEAKEDEKKEEEEAKKEEDKEETKDEKEKETEEVKDDKEKEEEVEKMDVGKDEGKDEESKTEKEEEKKAEEMEVEEEESEEEEEEADDEELDLPPMFASLRKSAGEILKDLDSMKLNQLEGVLTVIKNMLKAETMEIVAEQIEKDIQRDIRKETKKKSPTIMNKYSDRANRCRAYIKVACKYIRKLRPGDEFQVKSIKEMQAEANAEEKARQNEEAAKQAEGEADKAEEAKWAEEIKQKEEKAKQREEKAKRKAEATRCKEEARKAAEKKRKEEEKKKKEEEEAKRKEEEKKKKEEEAKEAEEKTKEEAKEAEEKTKEEAKEAEEKTKEEAKEAEEKTEEEGEGMETDEKTEEEKAKDAKTEDKDEKAEVDEEAKDKETDADNEGKAKDEEREETPMEEEEEVEEDDEEEEPEPEKPMPWERLREVTRMPRSLKTEREYYAMREVAQKAKDEMTNMNTYRMDMTLNNFNTYLHHDDLRNIASLVRVESHKEREKAVTDPLNQLKLNLRVTLEYVLNLLPDAHEGFEHFREFLNPEGKMKVEERFFRIEKFFLEIFRHLAETKHGYRYWNARIQTIRKAMKLTDTKRYKHRLFISRKRNFMQEEQLFTLERNLTEMESVTIQLKVHCEVALAVEKGLEKLNDELDFSKKEKIADEDQVAALKKEKEEFIADMQKFEDLFCSQDKPSTKPKSEADLADEEKLTFAPKHGIWWRGLLYDPVPQSVQRIPMNGQIAMFYKLLKDIPASWLSLVTMASRANKKDVNKWLDDMEKTSDGHYVCVKCGFGFRKLVTCLFHSLLCGKSGWTFCPLCKTDLQTESMYWFDRHLEKHMNQAESAYTQCGKPEITLGFTLNELVQMLVNSASLILKIRQYQKKAEDTKPEVECPSTEEKFNKTKETISNILNDLDDLTNGELCDLGVQLRKAVGIKAMEDIREIVSEAIESERRSPDWNPANDKYFKSSEARLSVTLKIGYDYMMNLEGHDITKSKGVVKEKTMKQYVKEHYTTDEEMLIVMYHQAVTCMRVLAHLPQPAMAYIEGKFNDIMRSDSTAEVGIVCQKEAERLKKEKASNEERNPTKINLKATCVYVLNMDAIEKKSGSDRASPPKPTNSEERFLVLQKVVSHTQENMKTIPPERLQVVLHRIKASLGEKTLEDLETKIKEEIEKEKESEDWTEDKYEDPVNKLKLDFKVHATYYTNIPYPDPYEDIERLKETWKPTKEVKADTKLQIAKEVFTMLLKQKRDSKLGEDYWSERIKAVIKCIGVVSSQDYYNPHYTWIRHNQSEEQLALKQGRYPTEHEATMQHLKVLFAQVSRVIKKELTPGNVMEDLDMRPISRKTINTPNLDILKENFIKWAKEVLEGKVEEQKLANSYEELQEIDKGEMKLDMQPLNFADYRKTYKMIKLEAPNDNLMKKVIKAAEELLKDGNKLEETVGKIEFVDEGSYTDIEKRAGTEEVTDKHKARLVDISIEKYIEGHYVCGTCGAGFMMFDNCVLHSLICGLEKVIVKCEWCASPFSFKQYNMFLYRYQRHMEKHYQDLYAFIQATEQLPPNPDAPVEEAEEKKEEKSEAEAEEKKEEKSEAEAEEKKEEKSEAETEKTEGEEKGTEKTETKEEDEKVEVKEEDAEKTEESAKEAEKADETEKNESSDAADKTESAPTEASDDKLEEQLLSGGEDVKDVQEVDEEKLLAESMDTSAEDLDTSVASTTESKEEAAEVEEEKPKPQRPQRATRGRKRKATK